MASTTHESSIDSTITKLSATTLSMTAPTPNLTTLPIELLTHICFYLDRPDLRATRYISPSLQLASSSFLFSTVYLKVNLTSFKRLQEIADHPLFSTYVRYIHYDGRQLYHEGPDPNFREWKRLYAGNGLPFSPTNPDDEFVSLFTSGQLLEFYNRYCLYLTGQNYILRFENEKTLLVAAMRKLRSLKGVKYYLKEDDEGLEDSTTPFSALSPIARDILVMPSKSYTEKANNHIWNLMDAITRAGLNNVKEVEASDLSLRMWRHAAGNHTECYIMMEGLEKLHMNFGFERCWPGDARPLAQILTYCTGLRDLRISFDTMIFSEVFAGESRAVHLTDFIPSVKKWDSLIHLSLQAVVATEHDLKSFLRRHTATLKSLELSTMLLERDMTIEDPRKRHGSWIRVIEFLHHEMALEMVKIQGIFYNGVDESWYISSDENDVTKDEACLKRRVERYVMRKGPYPFETKATGKRGKVKVKEDESWSVEEFMLRGAPNVVEIADDTDFVDTEFVDATISQIANL